MSQKRINKLELTWIGKDDERPAIEPRILIEDPKLGYGKVETGTLPNGKPWPGNMLIHGDNLLALRAIEENFTGAVKCIYIDPPYNTGNAFEHYDDNLEHSIWLNLMYQRIKILYSLISDDGVMCLHLDDSEVHYAKVICDEIFGRLNFVATIAIRSSTPSGVKTAHRTKKIIKQKDLMLVYKKSDALQIYPQYVKRESWDSHYSLFITESNGKFILRNLVDVLVDLHIFDEGISIKSLDLKDKHFRDFYIENRDRICRLQSHKNEDAKVYSNAHPNEVISYISKDGNKVDQYYNGQVITRLSGGFQTVVWNREVSEDLGMLLCDFWEDIDFQNTQNEGGVEFPTSKKPEALLYRVLSLFTKEGDIVLDSFLGSGTTAAVAHKMGRRWIGVELGDHAYTHCAVRMKKVIDGEQGGISKSVSWQGGGGFKFYELAPSLLNHDKHGNLVINKEYNADMLAAAMAKQEGYTYQPSTELYWKQGYGSEHDYIFTTTQFLTVEALEALHDQMGDNESLLICCTSFQPECRSRFSDITLKKIPQILLGRCEFDRNDYSLNIVSPPAINDDSLDEENGANDSHSDSTNILNTEPPSLFD